MIILREISKQTNVNIKTVYFNQRSGFSVWEIL